jgi:hypothetical protein
MNTSNTIRLNIIEFLFKVEDDKILETIYKQMTETVEQEVYTKSTDDDIPAIAKEPIPDYISSAQIEAEQGGFSMEKFWNVMDNWNYELFEDESLEDMLNVLTK